MSSNIQINSWRMDLNRPRTQRRSLLNIYLSIHRYADIAVVNYDPIQKKQKLNLKSYS